MKAPAYSPNNVVMVTVSFLLAAIHRLQVLLTDYAASNAKYRTNKPLEMVRQPMTVGLRCLLTGVYHRHLSTYPSTC